MTPSLKWTASRLTRVVLLGLSLTTGLPAAAALDFDAVFSDRGEPAGLHFKARYRLGQSRHRLELWRDGGQRLRRRTDEAIDTYIGKPEPGGEWVMTVLDRRRRVRTDISRSGLARIGHFADRFGLAHGLSRPYGPYRLSAAKGPAGGVRAIARCSWFRLESGGAVSRICWSPEYRLPMLIVGANGEELWCVLEVETGPIAPELFVIDDDGYVRADADEDLASD